MSKIGIYIYDNECYSKHTAQKLSQRKTKHTTIQSIMTKSLCTITWTPTPHTHTTTTTIIYPLSDIVINGENKISDSIIKVNTTPPQAYNPMIYQHFQNIYQPMTNRGTNKKILLYNGSAIGSILTQPTSPTFKNRNERILVKIVLFYFSNIDLFNFTRSIFSQDLGSKLGN